MKIIYTYYCGVHAFGMVFHAFEKGFRILESGVHFYDNNIILMLLAG